MPNISALLRSKEVSDLQRRIISGALLGLVMMTFIALGLVMSAWYVVGLVTAVAAYCLLEILSFRRISDKLGRDEQMQQAGIVLISAFVTSVVALQDKGILFILLIIAILVVENIAAMYFGKKLSPEYPNERLFSGYSPGKTWVGFRYGWSASAILLATLFFAAYFTHHYAFQLFVIPLALIPPLAEAGDAKESKMKRLSTGLRPPNYSDVGHGGVKDSGELLVRRHGPIGVIARLISGQGGLLDRMDGWWPSLTAAGIWFMVSPTLIQHLMRLYSAWRG